MIKLKEMRKKKGLTQAELAALVKKADPTVTQMTISVIENGELYPSERLRDALCEALECQEEDLYDGIEAMFVPAEEKAMSAATLKVAELLSEGRMTREQLREAMDTSDRQMRKHIETARQEGVVIANEQDGKGYYIPETVKELQILYRQNENRAMAILRQQKHIRRKLKQWT